jgi:predicted kinase
MVYFVLIRGPLGVGKSAVCARLSEELDAEVISIDRLLEEHGFWESGAVDEFLKANDVAAARARSTLTRGVPVLFDGNFYWRNVIDDLIRRLPYPHRSFTLTAPLGVCVERDRRRDLVHGRDAAREVYARTTAFEYGTIVDADRPLESVVATILGELDGSGITRARPEHPRRGKGRPD